MESSLWARLRSFLRSTYEERFMEAFSGVIMGLWGFRHLLFTTSPLWIKDIFPYLGGLWIVAKGVFFAGLSSLSTSYAAWWFKKRIEPILNKKLTNRKKKKRAA